MTLTLNFKLVSRELVILRGNRVGPILTSGRVIFFLFFFIFSRLGQRMPSSRGFGRPVQYIPARLDIIAYRNVIATGNQQRKKHPEQQERDKQSENR